MLHYIRGFCCVMVLSQLTLWGQSEVTLSVDNDLYFASDFYYSSGLFLQKGKKIAIDSTTSIHQFSQWKIGQLIYTPRKRYATTFDQIDYPFSGYLFLRYSREKGIKNHWGFRYSAELGISGDASLAKPVQNLYHELVLGLPALSWTAQMPQQLHIGFYADYYYSIQLTNNLSLIPDIHAAASTHQSRLSGRLGLVLGSTAKMPFDFNALWNTKKGSGVYLGWRQQYVMHDFALEGSLFNDAALLTVPSNRIRNFLEVGATIHNAKWQARTTYFSSSRDTPLQRDPRHLYLNISVTRFF